MSFSSKVMVDSSVWIDFFRNSNQTLDGLISEDLVCTNELILSELVPFLLKNRQLTIVESLLALDRVPMNIDWQSIRNYQRINLENGINGVGIPDLIIVQQMLDHKMELLSTDKHFKLMSEFLEIRLFDNSL